MAASLRKQQGFLRAALGWLLVAALIWAAYGWSERRSRAVREAGGEAPGIPPACADPFPPQGMMASAASSASTGAVAAGATTFANRTDYDLLLELGPESAVQQRVSLPAGASVAAALPAGAYAWRLRRGAAWCARSQRFVREQQIEITTPLELVASSRLSVLLDPGAQPTGVTISLRDQPVIAGLRSELPSQATSMSSDGRLVLARERDGHYRIDGAIDDQPLRFMIDTGATDVAVSQAFARRLGFRSGERVISRTANGTVEGYAFVVRALRIGPFAFENVRVTALPVLDGDALLGMRVLSAFEIRQAADTLVLQPVAAHSGG